MLDFNALEPGKRATDAIRDAAASLDLASRYQARVRLTGPVPIENEEFGTVREGAARQRRHHRRGGPADPVAGAEVVRESSSRW